MKRWAELTSFLIGAAAALVLLAGWRVPAGRGTLGADVTLSIGLSPVVQLSRTGTVLDSTRLRPGQRVTTAVTVHNPSTAALRLRPQAQAAGDATLNALLHVDVRADGQKLYAGSLAELARPVAGAWRLGPGASGRLTLRLTLPSGIAAGYAGRSTHPAIVLEVAR
jgi:hypothetical protein